MPKLLQLNECLNLSTGKIAQQIGDVAIKHGWESFIAYSGREKEISSNSKLIRVGSYVESCIHYVEDKLLDKEGLSSRIATKKLLRTIDKIKPDIVHLHNIHDHWLNYNFLFQYLANNKIPVVWTQHDQWATTGHCMYNICGCERWKEECHDCPISKWYSLDRSRSNYQLKKKLLANIPSLTIVPVSEWLGDNIRQSYLKNRPIKVIHNGIDIHTFSPQPTNAHERYGIDKDKNIILGVAAIWDERKGLNDFYELAKCLDKDKFAIIIVGQLTEEIKQVNGCQIVFVDRTQNALELALLYSLADVYVNPTYADMFPTVNLEALACGTPVITYRTGGSPEAIDANTGIVVEQGNIKALAEAVRTVNKRNFLSITCRRRAELYFDKNVRFEEYITLYNNLMR